MYLHVCVCAFGQASIINTEDAAADIRSARNVQSLYNKVFTVFSSCHYSEFSVHYWHTAILVCRDSQSSLDSDLHDYLSVPAGSAHVLTQALATRSISESLAHCIMRESFAFDLLHASAQSSLYADTRLYIMLAPDGYIMLAPAPSWCWRSPHPSCWQPLKL